MQSAPPTNSVAKLSLPSRFATVKSCPLIQSSVARVVVGNADRRQSAGERSTRCGRARAVRPVAGGLYSGKKRKTRTGSSLAATRAVGLSFR